MPPGDLPPHKLRIFVVAHTHWDREWYLPAGRFRQRLVALVDELLDGAASPGAPFLLDGQAVILDDYLAVRPGARELLGERLRDGSIEAGPWYVLADELIPSGEALVRNLLAGRSVLRSFDAEAPRVLYCPDSFGHPAALPILADGFGFPLIILWRGFGGPAWPPGDVFRWSAAGGASATVYHLSPDGYELGSSLPDGARAARERWGAIREALAPRATLGVVLLPNGADHHALQPHLDRAIASLASAAEPMADVHRASLADFARAVESAAEGVELPAVSGEARGGIELRNSYGYAWTLQGTLGARAELKRRNSVIERLFVRDMEPWVALAALSTGRGDRNALVRAAWKCLLLSHPHDTLCGCSVDEVARAMSARLDDAATQGRGLREDSILDIIGHDRVAARHAIGSWRPIVLVRNRAARPRGGVAELEVLRFREHVRVGPGSALTGQAANDATPAADMGPPSFSLSGGRVPFQLLGRSVRHDRVESPLAYPHDDLVDCQRVVAWIPPVAGYGVSPLSIDSSSAAPAAADRAPALPEPVRAGDLWLDNGSLRVEIDRAGGVRLESKWGELVQQSLIDFEDVGDVGDLYTHSPRGPVIVGAHFTGARLLHAGPLRGELRASWRLDVPEESARDARSTDTRQMDLHVALTLDAGAPFLRVRVWGENRCRDHRLRVVFRSGIADAEVWADAAFGVVRRTAVVAPPGSAESAPPTAPLARYVTLSGEGRGATLYSDGLAEYEASRPGEIAVTLFRAVGELSRNDLPERPGHAGWPAPTPEAQSAGAFEASFAFMPHGERETQSIALVERVADDVHLPLDGCTLRSALAVPPADVGVELIVEEGESRELDGCLAFSACKPTEDGRGLLLRCVNLTERTIVARWRLGASISAAFLARLDETPVASIGVEGNTIPFHAAPRAVVSVLVHAKPLVGKRPRNIDTAH